MRSHAARSDGGAHLVHRDGHGGALPGIMGAMPDFDAIAGDLLQETGVEPGTGFGSTSGLRVGGRIFAMHMDGDLVVKLPAERAAALVEAGCEPLTIGSRQMREWVRV